MTKRKIALVILWTLANSLPAQAHLPRGAAQERNFRAELDSLANIICDTGDLVTALEGFQD